MIWVTADDVILIHSRIIQTTGGIEGLRDRAGLEAAIAAPLQSFGGEDLFPSDIEKIARIGFGLASNHAFLDGNKRIGAMMTQLCSMWIRGDKMESREIKRIMSAKELPDVMTMPIVARTLGCSLNTAYALLNRQDFPRSVVGNRVYIDKEKFLAWLDAQTDRRR